MLPSAENKSPTIALVGVERVIFYSLVNAAQFEKQHPFKQLFVFLKEKLTAGLTFC